MNAYEIISMFKALSSKDVASTNQPISSFVILKSLNTFRNNRLRQVNVGIKHIYNTCLQSFYARRYNYIEEEGLRGVFRVPKVFHDAFGKALVSVYHNGCSLRYVGDKSQIFKYFGTKYGHFTEGVFYYDAASDSVVVNNSTIEVIEVRGIFEDPMAVPGFSLYDEYPCPPEYISDYRDFALRVKKPVAPVEIGKNDPIAS